MNSPKAFLLALTLVATATFAQNASQPSAAGQHDGTSPATNVASAADPGFQHLRLVQAHSYGITDTTTQDCIVVEASGRFHREKVENAREGTQTKAYEDTLSPEHLKQLSEIITSDQFQFARYNGLGQRRQVDRLLVDVWRKNGNRQSLHFTDAEIAKKYSEKLDPLLKWWKKIEHESAQPTKQVTGCRLVPQDVKGGVTQDRKAQQPSAPGTRAGETAVRNADQKVQNAVTPVPAGPTRFLDLRLWQGERTDFSGVQKQKCMVISRDGTFHREETSQGLNGTRIKGFKGKLSLEDMNALDQIVGSEQFRSVIHLRPPEHMRLRVSDPAVAINIWWHNGPQELIFPDTLSRKPYKNTVGELVKWWERASKLAATPVDDNDMDSCRPPIEGVADLIVPSVLPAAPDDAAKVFPAAATQPGNDVPLSDVRLSRSRYFNWYGAMYNTWNGYERSSDCMRVSVDGHVHGEYRLKFSGGNVRDSNATDDSGVKIFEGTLSPADLKTLDSILNPQAMENIRLQERQPRPEGALGFSDRLEIALHRGGHSSQLHFADSSERDAYSATIGPLAQWWEKIRLQLPAAKNGTADNCGAPSGRTRVPASERRASRVQTQGSASSAVTGILITRRQKHPEADGHMQTQFQCIAVKGDGHVHAEKGVSQAGERMTKVFEGTLQPQDVTAASQIVSESDFINLLSPQGDLESPEDDRLHIRVFRSTRTKTLTFRNAKDRVPYDATLAPLLEWWAQVSPAIPETKDAVANSCSGLLEPAAKHAGSSSATEGKTGSPGGAQ